MANVRSDVLVPPDRLHATCPVCDADNPRPLLALADHLSADRFAAVTCGACDTVYLVDPPTPDGIGRYYDTSAGSAMHVKPGPLFVKLRDRRIAADLAPLLARLTPDAPVADLGTGDGSVAEHLHRHGHRAVGLDIYPRAEWTHDGVPYRQISFSGGGPTAEDLAGAGAAACGAVMRHVLEHVHRPAETLVGLRAHGVSHVLVIVPNVESRLARRLGANWYYWDPPRHLTFFSADSLGLCAARAGYRLDFLRTYGLDELATSAHRALLVRGGKRALCAARALRPTGLIAGAASVAQAQFGDTVLHAVLTADGR
ncbi:MAG TPA: class I SAM-dependent methyltransferase [Baekduia sp.]|uniref:class I SAM-dependent methyltransferase n=1 Tax=Baekduia sp. TaxID=2600305 RepID=UPI002BD7C4E2|nr:class I SAM-dependent methyltransferase [Baekduia sp.]HMJ36419.1 class I SAM-dependent methyltransferase [Baekduia sp.]